MNEDVKPASGTVNRLIQEFCKLPGIGPKSAQRLAFFLLRSPREQAEQLAGAILATKQNTRLCSICLNVTDADPCFICADDRRDHTRICIVEQPQDIVAMEHTHIYKGLYHVLHGAISPTEGVGIENVRIKELLARLQDGAVTEIIMATNPNLEGEQTAQYLSRFIIPLGVRVTRLARGLPFGTELEYADDVTLSRAIEGRQTF